jgi:hypothetical protein
MLAPMLPVENNARLCRCLIAIVHMQVSSGLISAVAGGYGSRQHGLHPLVQEALGRDLQGTQIITSQSKCAVTIARLYGFARAMHRRRDWDLSCIAITARGTAPHQHQQQHQ